MPASTPEIVYTPAISIHSITSFITITLDSTNCLTWRSQVESILFTCDLTGRIDGFSLTPNLSTPAFLQWQRYDRLVYSCITATLSSSFASLAPGCSTRSCTLDQTRATLLSTIYHLSFFAPPPPSHRKQGQSIHYR